MGKISRKILTEASYLTGWYLTPPEYLSIALTYRCNFHCQACNSWKMSNEGELTTKEWLVIIKDLPQVLPKSTFVEISGGEPLIKKNLLLFVIRELKKYFYSLTLNSNGLLIDKPTIKELEKAGLDIIKISLYSLDSKTHDSLRGTPTAYKNALQAIYLIKGSKIKLEVGILITSKNIAGIPKLINHLRELGGISIILQPLDEVFYSAESKDTQKTYLPKDFWPNKKEVIKFFDWLTKDTRMIKNSSSHLQAIKKYYLEPNSALSYRCFAGQRFLVIYPAGEVSLCYKQKIIGNLKNDCLKNILRVQAIKSRKEIKNCQKFCRVLGCLYSRSFGEILKEKISPNNSMGH